MPLQGGHQISIRAPREGGDIIPGRAIIRYNISIHAPREGGDNCLCAGPYRAMKFQSTPPVRGATR